LKMGKKRLLFEIIIFLCLVTVYIVLNKKLAGKAIFICPVILLILAYFIYSVKSRKNALKEFGVRFDNIIPASKLTFLFFFPFVILILIIFIIGSSDPPPLGFYYTFLLYPVWGISQQFIFQSFLHNRLLTLGVAPWSILIVAIVYASVHVSSTSFFLIALIGGLISSYIFYKYPNIIPIGIAHGIIGSLVYYLIFRKDVLSSF